MEFSDILRGTPDSFEIVFKGGRTALYSNPRGIPLKVGDHAIVEVERGKDIGQVVREGEAASTKLRDKGPRGSILRRATSDDQEHLEELRIKEQEAHHICQQYIGRQNLPMKLVDVEWQFDSNKIRFYFTSDRRVDFRKLVRDLAGVFKTRIEMRQIGVRDEARRLGGYGRCGRYYCCRGVIGDFDPVTLKMVKEQHLAPGSPKISGGCGRLMCCLRYERSFYSESLIEYPKIGTRINLGDGTRRVTSVDIFHRTVTLEDSERETIKVAIDDYKKGRLGPEDEDKERDLAYMDLGGKEIKLGRERAGADSRDSGVGREKTKGDRRDSGSGREKAKADRKDSGSGRGKAIADRKDPGSGREKAGADRKGAEPGREKAKPGRRSSSGRPSRSSRRSRRRKEGKDAS
jgi:cell fate regulator YaaT (PSP1 superfamily)